MLKLEITYGSNHKYRWHVKEISEPLAQVEHNPYKQEATVHEYTWTERDMFQSPWNGFNTWQEAYTDFLETIGKVTAEMSFVLNGTRIGFAKSSPFWHPLDVWAPEEINKVSKPLESDDIPWWKRIFGGHKRI